VTENPRDPNTDDVTDVEPAHGSAPRTPRWVIVLGIVALILLLAVLAQFVLGIQHGPGLHGSP
jgi:hypothetical protein